MGRAKNTLKESEVSSTPIKLRYSVTYASNSLEDYGITVKSGSNILYDVNMSSAQLQSMNNYRVVKQLYYQQSISGSANSSSFWYPSWQSTAASGTLDATAYSLPTQTSESIIIFTIPSTQFGEQISRTSFIISSSGAGPQYKIQDDGNGNLVDTLASNQKVGNIFYAQGVAIITNPDYTAAPISVIELTTELDEPLITEAGDSIII